VWTSPVRKIRDVLGTQFLSDLDIKYDGMLVRLLVNQYEAAKHPHHTYKGDKTTKDGQAMQNIKSVSAYVERCIS